MKPDTLNEQDWSGATGLGDVNSKERGSGARYNTGKPAMELLPISDVADLLRSQLKWTAALELDEPLQHDVVECVRFLGLFQNSGDDAHLYSAMSALGPTSDILSECASVFDYGKRKYAEWNWAKGMKWSVPLACALRHLLAMFSGEHIDPIEQKGSGLPHRGHVMCNLFMLTTYIHNYKEGNDLPVGLLRR